MSGDERPYFAGAGAGAVFPCAWWPHDFPSHDAPQSHFASLPFPWSQAHFPGSHPHDFSVHAHSPAPQPHPCFASSANAGAVNRNNPASTADRMKFDIERSLGPPDAMSFAPPVHPGWARSDRA